MGQRRRQLKVQQTINATAIKESQLHLILLKEAVKIPHKATHFLKHLGPIALQITPLDTLEPVNDRHGRRINHPEDKVLQDNAQHRKRLLQIRLIRQATIFNRIQTQNVKKDPRLRQQGRQRQLGRTTPKRGRIHLRLSTYFFIK